MAGRICRWASKWQWLAASAVMLLLGVAGLSKCMDLPYFDYELKTWSMLPLTARKLIVLVVPPLEIAVALAWFFGYMPRIALAPAVSMLVGSTALYAMHLLFATQPRCACGGLLVAFVVMKQEGPEVLGRNAILLVALLLGAIPSARSKANTCNEKVLP